MTASAKATSPNWLGTSSRASTSVATKTSTFPAAYEAPAQMNPLNARRPRSGRLGMRVLGEDQAGHARGHALVHVGVPIDGAGHLGGEALDGLGADAHARDAKRRVAGVDRARQRDSSELESGAPRGGERIVVD